VYKNKSVIAFKNFKMAGLVWDSKNLRLNYKYLRHKSDMRRKIETTVDAVN